ncbi:MAG: ThiF family adenylyltransferase [Mobilitalea sp.]
MQELMLNKYVPILKSKKGYIFGTEGYFSLDSDTIKSFDKNQEIVLEQLINGDVIAKEYLLEIFGEELFSFFMTKGLFVLDDVDTDSIYSRSKAYYFFNNMGNVQKKLAAKTVLILGCGGIGTHVAWNLAVLGVGRIVIVDFDTVEESNLNRQLLFDQGDVGRLKVDVLKGKLNSINPQIEVIPINKKIWSEEELDEIVASYKFDLVVKSLDSPAKFPLWLDNICEKYNIKYISGITVSTSPMIGPTYLPGVTSKYTDFFDSNESEYRRLSGISQSLGVVMYHISSEVSLEAFKILSDTGKLKYINCIYTEDLMNGKKLKLEPRKTPMHFRENDKINLNLLVIILMLSVFMAIILFDFLPAVIINFLLCIVSPFFIYKSREKIARSGFFNNMIFFPILVLIAITNTDFLAANSSVNIITLLISLFIAFSINIVFSQLVINFLFYISRREKRC